MPSSVGLGERFEAIVEELVKKGRYHSRDEVLRAAVLAIQEREQRLAELEAALAVGVADIDAGRFRDLDEVAERLDAKYAAMIQAEAAE